MTGCCQKECHEIIPFTKDVYTLEHIYTSDVKSLCSYVNSTADCCLEGAYMLSTWYLFYSVYILKNEYLTLKWDLIVRELYLIPIVFHNSVTATKLTKNIRLFFINNDFAQPLQSYCLEMNILIIVMIISIS